MIPIENKENKRAREYRRKDSNIRLCYKSLLLPTQPHPKTVSMGLF